MKVYIAGPMSGIPEFNYPAFNTAEGQLFVAGFMPLNPARSEAHNTTGKPQSWVAVRRCRHRSLCRDGDPQPRCARDEQSESDRVR